MFWRASGLCAWAHSVHSICISDQQTDRAHGVSYHKYADDTQLYTALTANPNACTDRLESCSAGLQRWFCKNDLLLKLRQIRSLLLLYLAKVTTCRHAIINQSCRILHQRVRKLKTLGVTLDSALTFEDHINGVVCSCNLHIRALGHIRRHLMRGVANTLACSIVGTRIDYCNFLFYGASEKYINKLQRLQNKLARIVTNTGLRAYHLLIFCASCTGCLFGVGYPFKWQLCVVVR